MTTKCLVPAKYGSGSWEPISCLDDRLDDSTVRTKRSLLELVKVND